MHEYIEREATYTIAKKICNAIRNGEYHPAVFAYDIMDWIDDIPAADVVPVRHGRWVYDERSQVICHLCGNVVAFVSHPGKKWEFGHYCPNCGAKMKDD